MRFPYRSDIPSALKELMDFDVEKGEKIPSKRNVISPRQMGDCKRRGFPEPEGPTW